MKESTRYPKGFRFPEGTKVVALNLPGNEGLLIKIQTGVYLLCSMQGVSSGNTLDWEEVRKRILN